MIWNEEFENPAAGGAGGAPGSSGCAAWWTGSRNGPVLPEEARGGRVPARGIIPSRTSPASPSHEDRPAGHLSLRAVRTSRWSAFVRIHASSGTTGKPVVVGYTRRGHRHVGGTDGPDALLRRHDEGRHRPERLRVRALHGGLGAPLRAEKNRRRGIPISGGNSKRTDHADAGLRVDHPHSTPSYA
jgi:hypothetical protein